MGKFKKSRIFLTALQLKDEAKLAAKIRLLLIVFRGNETTRTIKHVWQIQYKLHFLKVKEIALLPLMTELKRLFQIVFEADGITFEEPTPQFFSFNNPFGACKVCEVFGSVIGIDEDLVIPDKKLICFRRCHFASWKGEKMTRMERGSDPFFPQI
jgi:excinuclease UvrABC ATPase subunit